MISSSDGSLLKLSAVLARWKKGRNGVCVCAFGGGSVGRSEETGKIEEQGFSAVSASSGTEEEEAEGSNGAMK